MTHDPATCPACADLAMYQQDRQGWAKAHAPAWVLYLKTLPEESRREAWKRADPESRAAVKELQCAE